MRLRAALPDLLVIHGMKTAGTSLRGMLTDGLGADGVDPNDTVLLLRDPIARAMSMMDHRRTRSAASGDASYADLLDDPSFVRREVRDYQTKVLAFDSVDECPKNVNVALASTTRGSRGRWRGSRPSTCWEWSRTCPPSPGGSST